MILLFPSIIGVAYVLVLAASVPIAVGILSGCLAFVAMTSLLQYIRCRDHCSGWEYAVAIVLAVWCGRMAAAIAALLFCCA